MSALKEAVAAALEGLAEPALEALLAVITKAKSSGDAANYLKRKAEADAAHIAAQELAKKELGG